MREEKCIVCVFCMRQSILFTKTRKEAPSDEVAQNAKLLIRGGYIAKEMAGVYDYLPLGLRVRNNIADIIREEMDAAGGQELKLTALQDPAPWKATDRWDNDAVDNWFKTELAAGGEVGLGFTHEEPITRLMTEHIQSYRDLPVYPYQLQTKFRNELRAKSGIMRGREFLMKDLYSFSRTDGEHDEFYEKMKEAYRNVFDRVGIGEQTHLTFASGGSFSEFSHEFQTVTDAGEDTVYLCTSCRTGINDEIRDVQTECPECGGTDFDEVTAVEVGNIFSLGTRFSDALGLTYTDRDGQARPVVMGSYGIGIGRLMGTVVEVLSDGDGIVWPASIAPYDFHLIALGDDDEVVREANRVYRHLQEHGRAVLYDDRAVGAGEKFADADLLGIPVRIVVSEKTMERGALEVKDRATGDVSFKHLEEL